MTTSPGTAGAEAVAQGETLDLLIIVSTAESGRVLGPLAGACRRRGLRWGCFFTNDGVRALEDPKLARAMACAAQAVACEHSWARFAGSEACPVALGSQTDNSTLVGRAGKVIGL